ncbi:MAG: hypothetical protein D6776_03460 [Planctomycetota bacterium]|nr:MAG: hypothetical protein D6776_03460 [Planctomycetota bacterium]
MYTIQIDAGTGEGESPSAEQLAEQRDAVREKVLRDVSELREVLAVDLPAFVLRQVKERYVSGAAPRLEAEKLRALKEDARAAGQAAGAEILAELERAEPWLEGVQQLPDTPERRRSLEANPVVDEALQRIARVTEQVLERHGFPAPEGGWQIRYRLPAWFIAGRLAISLVESYWRGIETLQRLEAQLAALEQRAQRSEREAEWDAV